MKRWIVLAAAVLGTVIVSAQDSREWPRIMVILDERVDGQESDGRIVAARIEELFLEKGFRLVDKAQFENVTARDIAIAEGNPMRAKEIGLRYGAELIFVGKASAVFENEKEFYGVKSVEYASKGDAKVIITDTGELIAVSAKNSKKSASGRSTASTLALQSLAEALSSDLYVKTLEYDTEKINGNIFNAGYDNQSLMEIATTVREVIDPSLPVEVVPSDDMRSYHISSEKIKKVLGFVPAHSVRDAVIDLKNAFTGGLFNDPMNNSLYYNIKRMKEINLK